MSSSKSTLDSLKIDRSSEPTERGFRAWIYVAGLVLLTAAVVMGWRWTRTSAVPVVTLLARETTSASERTVLNASGYVTARRQATVSSKVTARVERVFIEEGMEVRQGQVLAELDSSNVTASLRLAEAQLEASMRSVEETRAQLKEAQIRLRRTRSLVEGEVASDAELDSVSAEVDTYEARLARQEEEISVARQQVAVWKQQLDDTIIRAPFDGIVTTKDAQPGEMISPVSAGGGFTRTGIGTVVDMSSLEIEVDVNESYINRVEAGQEVEATLDAYSDWKIPSRVIAIVPTADRDRATVRVRIGFESLDPRILPDMAVKVAFRSEEEAGGERRISIRVPAEAVREENGREVVFVVKDGMVERRAVTTTPSSGEEVFVVSGLAAGERVVIEAPAELMDGQKVVESER